MKKFTSRALSIFLAMLMIISVFQMSVITSFAIEDDMVITVQNEHALIGSSVELTVSIENNPGVLGAALTLNYDSDLTLTDAVAGEAFADLTMTKPGTYKNGCNFVWDAISDPCTGNGLLLTLTFQISEKAVGGEVYGVSVTCKSGAVVDSGLAPVSVETVAGSITVIDYIPGDLNNNGEIGIDDLILLRRHIAGGYDQVINEKATDFNGDNDITVVDVIYLRRYLAGGYDVEPVYPAHTHNIVAVDAVEPDCISDGNIEYWKCTICGQCYSDEDGTSVTRPEKVVVFAIGHDLTATAYKEPTYKDSGNIDYWYCENCGKYFSDAEGMNEISESGTVLPPVTADYYSIGYRNTRNAAYPDVTIYYDYEGLSELPELSADGYNFDGWYTKSVGGDVVDSIPAWSGKDIILYAHWSIKTYTITYANKDAKIEHDNPTTYTMESSTIYLSEASLQGLLFDYWSSDEEGRNKVETISRGSTGDITLFPNWKSVRNKAVPASEIKNPAFNDIFVVDEEKGTHTFGYYLGEIQSVPVSAGTPYAYSTGKYEISHSGTVSVDESYGIQVSSSVENATTNSHSWGRVKEWSKAQTDQHAINWNVSATIGKKDASNVSGGVGGDHQWTDTSGWGESDSTENSCTYEHKNSEGYSTQFEYAKTTTTETNYKMELNKDYPAGYYRMAVTANVHVFGVVSYNAVKNEYSIYTYSILGEYKGILLDYSKSSNFDDHTGELPFIIPDEVEEYVDGLTASTEGLIVNQGSGIVLAYSGMDTDVVIPTYYNGVKINGIAPAAFAGSGITSLTCGDYVKAIPDGAFAGCSALKTINCPAVTSIGNNAFKNCSALEEVNSGDLTSIGDNAFEACTSLASFDVTGSTEALGKSVFLNCGKLELSVTANSADILASAISSGATSIKAELSGLIDTLDGMTLDIGEGIDSFELDGDGRSFENLYIISHSGKTIIYDITLDNNEENISLAIYSGSVNLNDVVVKAYGIALYLFAENTELAIGNTVNLNSGAGKVAFVSNNVNIVSDSQHFGGELSVVDIMAVYGEMKKGDRVFVRYTGADTSSSVTFDGNGGAPSETSRFYDYGYPYGVLPTATKQGNVFEGWYTEKEGGEKIDPASDLHTGEIKTLYAQWKYADDTVYTVRHYQQNVNNDNYTLVDTDPLEGTTNSTVTPAVKSYTGFKSPGTQSVVIKEDGSTLVEYRYTRKIYSINYNSAGGSVISTQTYRYGATVYNTAGSPSRTGWTFKGWNPDCSFSWGNTMPAHNITMTAQWSPKQFTYSNYDQYLIGDAGGYGLYRGSDRRYETLDFSSYTDFMSDRYTFEFSVKLKIREKDDGYQEVYLYNNITESCGAIGRVTYEAAVNKGMIAGEGAIEHGSGYKDTGSYLHGPYTWNVSGGSIKEKMYIRYDAWGSAGSNEWYRDGIEIVVNIYYNYN